MNSNAQRLYSLRGIPEKPTVPAVKEMPQLVVKNFRDLYRAPGIWAWMFDLAFRAITNTGNWTSSVGRGLRDGYLTFRRERTHFREVRRMRPPIFVTGAEARRDFEEVRSRNQIVWR